MELTDMKRTKKELKKDKATDMPMEVEREEYPYGLEISLESESLKKLNIDPQKLSVGGKAVIQAEAKITRISLSMDVNRDRKSASFQITKMNITKAKSKGDLDWDTPRDEADKNLKKNRVID